MPTGFGRASGRIGESVSEARFVATIDGFRNPESVRYDADQAVFFVSNVAGYGSVDGNGYVSLVSAADPARASPQVIVRSGRNGALLHTPKGMALHGVTLRVADIDLLRGFDRRTGSPLATIHFAGASVRRGTGGHHRVASGLGRRQPNGIPWDAA